MWKPQGVVLLILAITYPSFGLGQEVPGCGNLHNAYGPFDYRDPVAKVEKLPIVEENHFTPEIESLERGVSGSVIQELNYTLKAFPNHHRALNAVGRYALKGGKEWANRHITSADCYFLRAVAFAPNDEMVRVMFGNYLARRKEYEAAIAQFEVALGLAPESIEVHYNAGLVYLQLGDLEKAKMHAQIAYAGGHPLPGLGEKIAAAELRANK